MLFDKSFYPAELKVIHQAIYREKLWASLIRIHKKGLAQLHKNRNLH